MVKGSLKSRLYSLSKTRDLNLIGDCANVYLRRSCHSLLTITGIPGHVAERCLNHKLKGLKAYITAMTILMNGAKHWKKNSGLDWTYSG